MVVQPYTEAYDALDPTANITIKWDVISWTPDGYIVSEFWHNIEHHKPFPTVVVPIF